MKTLAESLSEQITRVSAKRARWVEIMRDCPDMAPAMRLGVELMRATIEAAQRAATSGDALAMLNSHEALAAFSDDD